MASVSEATMIYNTRIVPCYVSSNGYYGYVPPSNELVEHHSNYQQVLLDNNQHHELQQQPVRVTIGPGINIGTSSKYLYNEQQHYDYNNTWAMETGGDQVDIEDTQHHQNYHCVIPETMRRLVTGCNGDSNNSSGIDGVGVRYHVANNNSSDVTISQRESRKRSYNDPGFLLGQGTGRMKKLRQGRREFTLTYRQVMDSQSDFTWLRQIAILTTTNIAIRMYGLAVFSPMDLWLGGGNSHVCHGTDGTGEHGSVAVFNEPASLCLDSNITNSLKLYSSVANNCCAHIAAGNFPLINHKFSESNCETKRCSVTSTSHVDYEHMLMETHGCSAYHHYRHQLLDIGIIENEF